MANPPPRQDLSQYNYGNISSLVLTADRSVLPRRDREPDGAPTSLVGKIKPGEMGSRVVREKPASSKPKKTATTKKTTTMSVGAGFYQPKTAETTEAYSLLLTLVQRLLGGDNSEEIVYSAVEAVLETLKSDDMKDFDKKREIEEVLGNISGDDFGKMVGLGKKISDYGEEDAAADKMVVEGEGGIDDEMGVAVVFDDEDDDEEEDDEEDNENEQELRDSDSESNAESTGEVDDDDDNAITFSSRTQHSTSTAAKPADEIVPPHTIDAFWVQRQISTRTPYTDPTTATTMAASVLSILSSDASLRDAENGLMELFEYQSFDLTTIFLKNRDVVVWATRLARSTEEERKDIEVMMREKGVGWILRAIEQPDTISAPNVSGTDAMDVDSKPPGKAPGATTIQPQRTLDLEALAFSQGGHLMTNKKCKLPAGSFKRSRKGFEEIHIPAPTKVAADPASIINIASALPSWARKAFTVPTLNVVQSRVFPTAWGSDENILLCAPTGAGKTNVALLTMLRELGKWIDEQTGQLRKGEEGAFKIVYVAPMKALVQEVVGNFKKRLESYNITVSELTGDSSLTRAQIASTQIIVTTPEKWDVITRKGDERSYLRLVRLVIIDEIHLLHDDRGPVLESIIARTLRGVEKGGEGVRVVGLSATLPNFEDVARFLRVRVGTGALGAKEAGKNKEKEGDVGGLFYFDAGYRPCGLQQQFIGINEKKAIKRYTLANEICFEKTLEQVEKGEQVLVFVHSRKETGKTARSIRDTAIEKEVIATFIKSGAAGREILSDEAARVKDPVLKDLLVFGVGIHHAGLDRADRALVESLFADGYLQVLVCTATLAWGVNLPAHAVIIKGTQIYNPAKSAWVELSPQDMLQMLGRAGRPQYDTYGEGVVITNGSELQYYLSLVNAQLPIESQLIGGGGGLVEALNAEIVLGNVRTLREGVEWLGWTYLYVRMLRSPALYGVSQDYAIPGDDSMLQKRADLIHSAAVILEKTGLVKYERGSGMFISTELGRIASHFYITPASMQVYNKHMKPGMGMIELFRVFAMSGEFKFLGVRAEEKLELTKLLDRVPIPVKESVDEPLAKVNVLLQAYISGLKLEGFALLSDMVYIHQSASRILRALFMIAMKRGWAVTAKTALEMCKMVEQHMWPSMTPLRQFKGVPGEVIRKAEGKAFPWWRWFDLSPPELAELLGVPNAGRLVHRLVHSFPRIQVHAVVQPITRSLIRVDLTLTPDFVWDEKVFGDDTKLDWWIIVEDVDGETVLAVEKFSLLARYAQHSNSAGEVDEAVEHSLTLTVPISDSPLPPNYYVTAVSDRWLGAETRVPISFKHLILPEKFPQMTRVLEMQPLVVEALGKEEYKDIYKTAGGGAFNKIQTQVFQALFTTDENVFVGAPEGSGKAVCADFALMRLWNSKAAKPRAVFLEPYAALVTHRVSSLKTKFSSLGKTILPLSGETQADLAIVEKSDVVVCTPGQWDVLSRRWRQRKVVAGVSLVVANETHMVGGDVTVGPVYEVVLSRIRYVNAQMEQSGSKQRTRIVAFGVSLSNAKDFGEWIGVPNHSCFNFPPSSRPQELDIHLQGYDIPHFPSAMIALASQTYYTIRDEVYVGGDGNADSKAVLFVSSRKQCRLTIEELLTHITTDGTLRKELEPDHASPFLRIDPSELDKHLAHLRDKSLEEPLRHGIGQWHSAMEEQDRRIVERLFEAGAIAIIVVDRDAAWGMDKARINASLVVVMGTQVYEGREHRYTDYSVIDVLRILGFAGNEGGGDDGRGKVVIMTPQTKKAFYRKFLSEGLPIESHLPTHFLADYFLAEIAVKTVENKQDALDLLTWTYFYRRLMQNPNYYGLHGVENRFLSDHLSEVVEGALGELEGAQCISIDEEGADETGGSVEPLNLGMIAAYYDISYVTVEIYALSLKERTKMRGILEVLASSAEFETIPIRRHEDALLRRLSDRVPFPRISSSTSSASTSPHEKAFLLLQAHLSRINLPADLQEDAKDVVLKTSKLVCAMVDVMSSSGWLGPAMGAMDLGQGVVQAVWVGGAAGKDEDDAALRQIPWVDDEIIKRAHTMEPPIKSVYDLQYMEDVDRLELLQMDAKKLRDVAEFVNRYPSLEVRYTLAEGPYSTTGDIGLEVVVGYDEEDEDEDMDVDTSGSNEVVAAPFYPGRKLPTWWIIIGIPSTKTLLTIKRVAVPKKSKKTKVKLEFTIPKPGKHEVRMWAVCDSYVGADQEVEVYPGGGKGEEDSEEVAKIIEVAEGEEESSDEEDSDEDVEMK